MNLEAVNKFVSKEIGLPVCVDVAHWQTIDEQYIEINFIQPDLFDLLKKSNLKPTEDMADGKIEIHILQLLKLIET